MKPLSVIAVGLAVLLPAVLAADDKKDDKAAKLLGTWEITKVVGRFADMPAENTALRGATFTFNKDGKLVLAQKNSEGTEFKFGGTYKVEGDKLIYDVKLINEELSSTETIKKLTDNELELVSSGVDGDTVSSLRRKKEKDNKPSPAEDFELTFPPGAEVHDSRDGKTYFVQPDGSFRLAPPQVPAPPPARPEPWHVRNRWLSYAVLIAVAVVVCVLYTQKKRRHSRPSK
jgi:uncharacterized protein (TIGR03066 family)